MPTSALQVHAGSVFHARQREVRKALHPGGRRTEPVLGRRSRVHESALRTGDRALDGQGARLRAPPRSHGGVPRARPHRYRLVASVCHETRGPAASGTPQVWRREEFRALSLGGGCNAARELCAPSVANQSGNEPPACRALDDHAEGLPTRSRQPFTPSWLSFQTV